MEQTREKAVEEILSDLNIFYPPLNHLIVDYDMETTWETKSLMSWNQKGFIHGLRSFQQHIYICAQDSNLILTLNTNGEIIKEYSSLTGPSGIDIDEKLSLLYIADSTHVTILNLKLEFLSSWQLPTLLRVFRGLKVDGNTLYLTVFGQHQIFLCNSQEGKILETFGTGNCGSKIGEFDCPMGITVDDKYVYICDYFNNRVQILLKEKGIYFSTWTEIVRPTSIYYHSSEDLLYVGSRINVQLFRKDGVCIQRLGDKEVGHQMNQFMWVFGICIMDDRLYISDKNNKRIQIFKRDTN